jgi:hypothetical protein
MCVECYNQSAKVRSIDESLLKPQFQPPQQPIQPTVPQQPCLPCHELQFNDFEIAGSINVNSHPTSDENFWDDDDFIDSLLYDAIAGGGWSCGIIGDNWETTTTRQ